MRPIKDLLSEEFWSIAFRPYSDTDSVVDGTQNKVAFRFLNATKRYWYADPFLFEKDGKTYLFVEMFDDTVERGVIGVCEWKNGTFTTPQVVLSEPFHLSYPVVFERDGKIFMMPETHQDHCIQFYECEEFPVKWKKSSVQVENIRAVDTVIENGLFLTSVICPENDMSIDLCAYDATGNALPYSPMHTHSFTKRGAGNCFTHNGVRLRPSQDCRNGNYGGGILFNRILQCDRDGYVEEPFSAVTPERIDIGRSGSPEGIHTYARTRQIEVVDVKLRRTNIRRLFWIVKNKLK